MKSYDLSLHNELTPLLVSLRFLVRVHDLAKKSAGIDEDIVDTLETMRGDVTSKLWARIYECCPRLSPTMALRLSLSDDAAVVEILADRRAMPLLGLPCRAPKPMPN